MGAPKVFSLFLFSVLSLTPAAFADGGDARYFFAPGVANEALLAPVIDLPRSAPIQKVTDITNDRDKRIATLSVIADSAGALTALDLFARDPSGGTSADAKFTLAQIEAPAGVVLINQQGHDAVLLQGTLNALGDELDATIKYLSNGIFNTYKSCKVQLRRSLDGERDWALYRDGGTTPVTLANVVTSSIGIKQITGLCGDQR